MTAFDALFVPADVREAVSGGSWLEAMLEFERALAAAGATVGLVPPAASEAIADACFDRDSFRWEELQERLGVDGWTLHEGPILEKGVTPMRSFVAEPMQWRRLYLAGDAAHIVPPTGAKGLNLAVRDVAALAEALVAWYRDGHVALLEAYSETCLRRVWRAEHFSWWMTTMLHRAPEDDEFTLRLQQSQLRYLRTSRVAATSLAENYVGVEHA